MSQKITKEIPQENNVLGHLRPRVSLTPCSRMVKGIFFKEDSLHSIPGSFTFIENSNYGRENLIEVRCKGKTFLDVVNKLLIIKVC